MSHPANDWWYEGRAQWLEEQLSNSKELKIDKRGEYIQKGESKVYLPAELQESAEPTYESDFESEEEMEAEATEFDE